jgi:ferric-dicitrate binding protein FerR (iron transport regulator)
MTPDELRGLADAALDGRITAEQAARLEAAVLADPAVCRWYAEYAHQNAALAWAVGGAAPAATPARPAGRRRLLWAGCGAAVAAGVLLAVGLLVGWGNRAVATLAEAKACRWNGGSLPTEEGAALRPGRLRLAEGLARVRFASGAEVTLEGPADLELVTPMRCVLHAGQLTASVPPGATGFVVDTPTTRVTDYGTEFGVRVRDAGTADVQVFSGRVDVGDPATGAARPMTTGTALRFGPGGAKPFDPNAEPPAGPARPDAGRVVQISTAQGRGKDAFVQAIDVIPADRRSDTLLLLKAVDPKWAQWARKAYLGFDLAPVAGQRLLDAELSVTFAPTGMGFAALVGDATFAVYGLTADADWDERTLRWDAAPGNRPGTAVDPAATVKLGSFVLPQGTQTGTVTVGGPAVLDFLAGRAGRPVTVILVRETPGKGGSDLVHGVASRRHPTLSPPTLRLSVAGPAKP